MNSLVFDYWMTRSATEAPRQRVHRHQCRRCLTVWQHDGNCKGDINAHKCPTCGQQEREWYHGPLSATSSGTCLPKRQVSL